MQNFGLSNGLSVLLKIPHARDKARDKARDEYPMIYLHGYLCLERMRSRMTKLLSGLIILTIFAATNGATQELERVARFEQWPGVSQVIAYRDRIWLVNSEPFRDNNAADVYSYSIKDKSLRYERSLFSQDVGVPVVFNGLLHWPFEDPRRSAGSGEYAVTDGTNWQWQAMRSGSVMHVHAMNVCDGELVAATGSWTGQLHRQEENNDWEVQYDYPAAESSFSRIVSVIQLNDDCIVGASARRKNEAKLFTLKGDKPEPIDGWPISDRVDNLTKHQQSIFAFADSGNNRRLIRYDGVQTHEVVLPDNQRPRAMHSDGNSFWLVTHDSNSDTKRGNLWKYSGNNEFEAVLHFPDVPISITSLGESVVIGTYAKSGGALLVVNNVGQSPRTEPKTTELKLESEPQDLDPALTETLYQEIQKIIKDPQSTDNYARALRRNLGRHPAIKTPEFGAALTRVLGESIEGPPTTMFTGQSIKHQDLVRWFLITTLAINGNGRVDPDWISLETELQVPDSSKVFDPSIASIVASGWLKQNDKQTLRALITRLNRTSDPLWVKADVIGALTAITNQRFAYDVSAWNLWWSRQVQ